MKTFLVLVLLSVSSYANASVDLSCTAEGFSSHSMTTMKQENGNFTVIKVTHSGQNHNRETTRLYVTKKNPNMIGEIVYEGDAEQQVQVDVFDKFKFVLRVPKIIENKTVLAYLNDKNEEFERIEFRCVRPDNR
ncbi:MAG: hypothetical protein V4596_10335 [Bdellovibrionota bacterium]